MLSLFLTRLSESIANLWRVLVLVWESSRKWTIGSIVLVFLQGLVPIFTLFLMGRMIDEITKALEQGANASLTPVLILIALVGIVTFFDVALTTISGIVREGQTLSVSDYILKSIHEKSINVDLEYYENAQYHNDMHRVQQDAPFRPPHIVDSLLQTVSNLILLIGVSGLLLTLNSVAPLILFISAFPTVLVRMRFARLLIEWQRRSAEHERRALYLNVVMTYENYAKEVRLFGTGNMFSKRYDVLRKLLRDEKLAISRRRTIFELGVQLIAVAALFGAFALVVSDALRSAITIGNLVIAFQAFQRGQGAVQSLLGSFASLYENNLFLRDFYRFLALETRIQSPPQAKPIPEKMLTGIEFEDVEFQYAHGNRQVLGGVNLKIAPGEIVALVGENGAGKTTLIKLLCRLYDPTAGQITLDGIDLRKFDLVALRRAITVLFQDYNQYQMLAWENIWVGNIEQPPDRERIASAAAASGADEVISKLSHGYDTPLGNWFADGQELSIGQWQKVALARAFLRDTQLVVLDEPTSSLDVMAEYEVFERFREIVAGKSAILISHRLSTIRMADRIYVLDKGCIAESGSHDQLMALNGLYAKLFNTQSKYYR
jgi:ATP-binding cassette, subfamily B, bacterial